MPDQQHIAQDFLGTPGDFVAWFRLYDELRARRRPRIGPPTAIPLVPHSQILETADLLKSNPFLTRTEALRSLTRRTKQEVFDEHIEDALDIAVQAMLMTDCIATRGHASDFRRGGLRPKCWAPNDTFVHFLESSFCRAANLSSIRSVMEDQESLKSWKLAKKLRIVFKGTSNLADHLLYDGRYRTLYLFHHVAWLNAHFHGVANDLPFDCSMERAVAK
jgi:hypothetical protein